MENANGKKSEEILAEIYRNAQLALESISDILPQVDDSEARKELRIQHEEYEKFSARAAKLAKDYDIELKEPNPIKKAMMWGSIKMNTLTDNSRSHIADMMVQGTVMGITALKTTGGDILESEREGERGEAIFALLDEMIKAEEEFEKRWKAML